MKFLAISLNKIALTFLVLALVATAAHAQATTGSILGRVTDPSGAVISGAQVQATNEATGIQQSAQTDSSGDYKIFNLAPGLYTVSVSKAGFGTSSKTGLKLVIDQKISLDFELSVGSISATHTVTADPIILQTQTVETGEVIESKQILDLPLLGRNFLELTRLTPGVLTGGGGNTLNLAVNGGREFANSVLIDGVEATANRNNDTGLQPSVDAVEEFKVATSDYSAQYGRASGGSISVQTKSGSNGYHGSLYEFYRGNFTAARDYVFKDEPSQPSQLKQHNFGGTIGGPIKKDKTFFFVSMEATRQRNGSSGAYSVPPTNQIVFLPNGDVDLSGLKDPYTGNTIPIYDPQFFVENYYVQQFPGNIIPADRISPAGKAILQNFFPSPNLSGELNGWYNNYFAHFPYIYNGKNGDVRVDHHFSDKDHLSAIYHYSDFNSLSGDPFWGGTAIRGAGDVDQGGTNDARNQAVSLSETHLFSSSFVNEFRFGYTRFALDQESLLNHHDYSTEFGVGNIAVEGFPSTMAFPVIYLGAGYQTGGSYYKPLLFSDSNFQFVDNMTLTRGKHEFRFGVDFRRLNSHPLFSLFPTSFQYFNGPYAALTSDPYYDPATTDYSAFYPNGGSDVADLLLGLPGSVQVGLQLKNPNTKSFETHFYGEDTWKVNDKLTFIYGVRYEFQNPYTEAHNNSSVFDPISGDILIAGRGGNSDALVNADKNNISPRVGLAYRATSKTVLRAGYGLFYSPENDAREDVLTQNYPFAVQTIYANSQYAEPVYTLDAGLPRVSTVPVDASVSRIDPETIANGDKQVVFYVDPNFRTGYTHAYNLTLEQQITGSFAVQAAYVGTNSRKLSYSVGDMNAAKQLSEHLGKIQGLLSEGNGSYNSLQLKARKQTGDFTFLASYTYGINIDNGPAPFNLGRGNNGPQDPYQLNLERAFADDDVRHNFVFSALYPLPFGKNRRFLNSLSKPADFVLGGWQMNTIFVARTGLPFNVVSNGNGVGNTALRPNLVADPMLSSGDRTLSRYFNIAAFCVPSSDPENTCPDLGPGGIGSAGRNILRGPGYVNADFSVFKDFSLKEQMAIQFRFEFFNLFNTPHFGNPNGNLAVKTEFGRIDSLVGNPRVVQFALKFKF